MRNPVRWSDKFRADHRRLSALEKVGRQRGLAGARVPVQTIATAVPFTWILIGASVSSTILANIAADAQRHCETRFPSEK